MRGGILCLLIEYINLRVPGLSIAVNISSLLYFIFRSPLFLVVSFWPVSLMQSSLFLESTLLA